LEYIHVTLGHVRLLYLEIGIGVGQVYAYQHPCRFSL
jgi:hypothetical protein